MPSQRPLDFTNLLSTVSSMFLQEVADADAAKERVQEVQVRLTAGTRTVPEASHWSGCYLAHLILACNSLVALRAVRTASTLEYTWVV